MSSPRDPFDFSDTSDLPAGIKASVDRKARPESMYARLFDLIGQTDRSVSAGEIRGAFFRVHGMELDHAQVSNALIHFHREGKITLHELSVR